MTANQGTGIVSTAGRRRRAVGARAMIRSVLLGATVFALAALAGVLLSGAAPAGPTAEPGPPAEPAPRAAETPATTTEPATGAPARAAADPIFAQSLVFSGAAALAVSAAGLVMVARRRRLW